MYHVQYLRATSLAEVINKAIDKLAVMQLRRLSRVHADIFHRGLQIETFQVAVFLPGGNSIGFAFGCLSS